MPVSPVPATPHGVTVRREFDSLAEFLETLDRPCLPDNVDYSRAEDNSHWSGGATLREVRAMIAGAGAPDIAAKVREQIVSMAPLGHPMPMLAQAYGVSGGAVDVERYLSGDPECMIDYSSPAGTLRTLDVYVNISASSAFSAEDIITRGAAVCAMIDHLEASGTRVRVMWTYSSTCSNTGNVLECAGLLKDYTAHLDLDLVAFVLAHPGMLRQAIFHIQDQTPEMRAAVRGHRGIPSEYPTPAGSVNIPAMHASASVWRHGHMRETVEKLFNGGAHE